MTATKLIRHSLIFAALLLCGSAVSTACSSDDNIAASTDTVPQRKYDAVVYQYLNKANDRESLDETGRKGYQAKQWRTEAPSSWGGLPYKFRWCQGDFANTGAKSYLPDTTYRPTRQGLDSLRISGSSSFSYKQLQALTGWAKSVAGDAPRYMIDIRQESHGYVNGTHLSWYGYINWSNIGKSAEQIISDEEQLIHSLRGQTITAGTIRAADKYMMTDTVYLTVNPDSAWTESEIVQREGWNYKRITALDHSFPNDATIDRFIEIYRSLPKEAWVHFHCLAGNGRTTLWMSFFDMLRNPGVPVKDILYRQCMIGGTSLYYQGTMPWEEPWRVQLFTETSYLVPLLHDYAEDNASNGYTVSWSEWKKRTFGL